MEMIKLQLKKWKLMKKFSNSVMSLHSTINKILKEY